MERILLGLVVGFNLAWVFMSLSRDGYWRKFNARRRGSNPPPPGRKPAVPAGPPNYDWRRRFNHENTNPPTDAPPLKLRRNEAAPAGPPEQPLTAQLIRYWALQDEQVRRALTDPCLGEPWPEDCELDQQDVPIRMDEGQVQRGGFGDGPATPKPLIKPQPTGGRQIPPLL